MGKINDSIKKLISDFFDFLARIYQRFHALPNYRELEETLKEIQSELYELSHSDTEDEKVLKSLQELKAVCDKVDGMTDEELIKQKDELLNEMNGIKENIRNEITNEYANILEYLNSVNISNYEDIEVYVKSEQGVFLAVTSAEGETKNINIKLNKTEDGYKIGVQSVESLPENCQPVPDISDDSSSSKDVLIKRVSLGIEQYANVGFKREMHKKDEQLQFRKEFRERIYPNEESDNIHFKFDKETEKFCFLDRTNKKLIVFDEGTEGRINVTLYKDCDDFSYNNKNGVAISSFEKKNGSIICTTNFAEDDIIETLFKSKEVHDYLKFRGIDPKIMNKSAFTKKMNYLEDEKALNNAKQFMQYLLSVFPIGKKIGLINDKDTGKTYICIKDMNNPESNPIYIDFHKDGSPKEIYDGNIPVRDVNKNFKQTYRNNETIDKLYNLCGQVRDDINKNTKKKDVEREDK